MQEVPLNRLYNQTLLNQPNEADAAVNAQISFLAQYRRCGGWQIEASVRESSPDIDLD